MVASASFCGLVCPNYMQSSLHVKQMLPLPFMQRRSARISRDSCRCRAAVEEQTQGTQQKQRIALGSVVIESTEPFPEPPRDFWEGEQWDIVGKLAIAFVPLLVAAGVGVGVFAAATYNEGADGFVKPASEIAPAEIVPAQPSGSTQPAPVVEEAPAVADAATEAAVEKP